jgi:phage portal protein BeeE
MRVRKDKPPEKRRLLNEVIHLKNYHPHSSYYGLPDFLPALRALVGNKKAGDFNITFFENNAVPQYAIIVKGNAHKTLILAVVQDEGEKVDIEIKPLDHSGPNVPFMMSAMGPLSLDPLAQGGVRPPMMPAETGKARIDSLLTLQDVIREKIRKRAEEPPAESEGEVPSLSQAGGNGR